MKMRASELQNKILLFHAAVVFFLYICIKVVSGGVLINDWLPLCRADVWGGFSGKNIRQIKKNQAMKNIFIRLGLCLALLVSGGVGCGAQERPDQMFFEVNGCRFEMVHVTGGEFMMGSKVEMSVAQSYKRGGEAVQVESKMTEEAGPMTYADETPLHGVELNGFYMGKYEVTQRLWEAVMGYNPSNFKGEDLPVEQVSYAEVEEFIARLNALTGVAFRLPTEAEWEYAARGGNRSKGYHYPGGDDVMAVGWSKINAEDQTHPVGSLVPNEVGLYDMSGNVWEWCADWYDKDAYLLSLREILGAPDWVDNAENIRFWFKQSGDNPYLMEFSRPVRNPKGPEKGVYRVGRGGSWSDEEGNMHSSFRNFWVPEKKLSTLGFRLALSGTKENVSNWMPDEYFIDSISDGRIYSTRDQDRSYELANGELPGEFSVRPDRKVRFSKGNLQYNAVTSTFRFADRQTDIIGEDNTKSDAKYPGWIDLFGWGTSGYRDHPPYYHVTNAAYYGASGEKNIDGTAYDWGVYNRIQNGYDAPGEWRTLSNHEWNYLFTMRPNAFYLHAFAIIEYTSGEKLHSDMPGIMLLPDDWMQHCVDTFRAENTYQFSEQQWQLMERMGAVFLPAAGVCHFQIYHQAQTITPEDMIEGINVPYGTEMPQTAWPVSKPFTDCDEVINHAQEDFYRKCNFREGVEGSDKYGYYWTTIHYDKQQAYCLYFVVGMDAYLYPIYRSQRCAVRLVKDVETR